MSASKKEIRLDEHNTKEKTTNTNVIENTDCPIFLRKTYHMIDTCDQAVAGWSEDGTSFLVKNVELLASNFLPQYFKHNQFSSFVRQLNFYGFRKEKNESVRVINNSATDDRRWHFRHENFVRGRPELLSNITRRIPNKGATRGASTGSSQRKSNMNEKKGRSGIESNEKERKECQSLKSEIASLQNKLHLMENNIDHLSKTLHLKLNINSLQSTRSDSDKVQSKIDEAINSQHNKSTNSNKRLKTKAPINKTKMTNSPVKKKPATLPNTKSSRATESSHVASSDLPDLSMATDEDLLMEDISTTLSRPDENRNDSSASLISSYENLSSGTIIEVDEMFASIENDLKTSMSEPAKEYMGIDIQPLPAFVPSFEKQCEPCVREQDTRSLALKKIEKVDCLLHDLKDIEKEEFVNKILTEMSTVFGKMALDTATVDLPEIKMLHEKGMFQANDLIVALERILAHQDIDEKSSPNLFTPEKEGKKSPFVKIEV